MRCVKTFNAAHLASPPCLWPDPQLFIFCPWESDGPIVSVRAQTVSACVTNNQVKHFPQSQLGSIDLPQTRGTMKSDGANGREDQNSEAMQETTGEAGKVV